jgi:Zn-dependent protease/CBS domain-containing protein
MPRSFRIATLGGITIQARTSALFAFLLLLWFLAGFYAPSALTTNGQRPSTVTLWSFAFISTLALYASTIAHELGHALVARARSIDVNAITVSLFGGHAEIPQDNQGPADEALISVSGPMVSIGIAAVCAAALRFLPNPSLPLTTFLEAALLLNGWLALYNLLPVPPLDGGRSLHGLLRQWRGDDLWATNMAVTIGRIFAMLLATASVIVLLLPQFTLSADFFGLPADQRVGIIGLALAWLLNNGARTFQRNVALQHRLAGLTVSRVMKQTSTVPPWTSLDDIVENQMRGTRAVLVVRADGTLAGLVAMSDIARVPEKDRAARTASEIMTPADKLLTVAPDEPVETAIKHMAQRHLNQLPVIEDGKLIGLVDRESIIDITEPTGRRF